MLEQNVKICNMCIATTGISRHFYFNFLSNNSCFKPYLILGPFFSIKNTHSLNINLSVDKINNFKDQIYFFHKTKQIVFETQIQKKKIIIIILKFCNPMNFLKKLLENVVVTTCTSFFKKEAILPFL